MSAPNYSDTEDRLRDLREVIAHEYAHLYVAQHYGVLAAVQIEPNVRRADDELHFAGRCRFYGAFPTRRSERLTSLAGATAVALLTDPDIHEQDICDCLDLGDFGFSDTDRAGAGNFSMHDLRGTIALVRKYWPQIQQHVEWGACLALYEVAA